jgi:hypothetical protein
MTTTDKNGGTQPEAGDEICRTCNLAIYRRSGYETYPSDLAVWRHRIGGKESCEGRGLWARAMPDLNPQPKKGDYDHY